MTADSHNIKENDNVGGDGSEVGWAAGWWYKMIEIEDSFLSTTIYYRIFCKLPSLNEKCNKNKAIQKVIFVGFEYVRDCLYDIPPTSCQKPFYFYIRGVPTSYFILEIPSHEMIRYIYWILPKTLCDELLGKRITYWKWGDRERSFCYETEMEMRMSDDDERIKNYPGFEKRFREGCSRFGEDLSQRNNKLSETKTNKLSHSLFVNDGGSLVNMKVQWFSTNL